MSPAQAQSLGTRGAVLRAAIHGITVTHKGEQVTVTSSASQDDLTLETGGFDRQIVLRLRFPASYASPAKGDAITFPDGRVFYVTHSQGNPTSPLAGDYVVEVTRT